MFNAYLHIMQKINLVFIALCGCWMGCHNNTTATSKISATEPNNTEIRTTENESAAFGYDLSKPIQHWKLPQPLMEVSGNAWVDSNHLLLIEDLHPNLYYIKLENKNAILEKTIPFGSTDKEKTDIEDVTIHNNIVYALWSHGIIFKISAWEAIPRVEKLATGLSKANNTEGLCYDPVTQDLLIACKDGSGVDDEKKSTKAIYRFDINNNKLVNPPFMMIHKKDFKNIAGGKLSFNPSAIAVHPITHDIYILTTKDNKGMAIFSHDGMLKSYQEIDKELMPQPEGICFSPTGILYISSEGKKGEPGNLFEFNHR